MTRREIRHSKMMARGTERAVRLFVADKSTVGEVRWEEWGRPVRLRRAAKLWAALWGLALVSVLIPGAHFILVPGFFIAAPIAAWLRMRQTSGILGGEGICPACSARMFIGAHDDSWPLSDHCDACRRPVRIEAIVVALPLPAAGVAAEEHAP